MFIHALPSHVFLAVSTYCKSFASEKDTDVISCEVLILRWFMLRSCHPESLFPRKCLGTLLYNEKQKLGKRMDVTVCVIGGTPMFSNMFFLMLREFSKFQNVLLKDPLK